MTDKETMPLRAARKLSMLFMNNEALARNKKLQQEIIAWAEKMARSTRF